MNAALPPRHWAPKTHAALSAYLAAPPTTEPRVAVFDWDNTSIYNDIADAVFCHQLDTLDFRLSPQEVHRLLPEVIDGHTMLDGGVSLADLTHDISDAYTQLWPRTSAPLSQAQMTPAHHDLRAKLSYMYRALERTKGIGHKFAYGWLAGWLGGFSVSEARQLAGRAARDAEHAPHMETWQSQNPGRSGHISYAWRRGLRPVPEIRDLMSALRDQGFTVYVVSASAEALVQGAAAHFDYAVQVDRVIGMRLRQEDGVFAPELDPAFPVTNRHGKVEAIKRFLPGPPLLVAGDFTTDYEMLTQFPETQIRLVINRHCDNEMQNLYAQAQRPHTTGPMTLLQGRDENLGTFRPAQESILFGETEPRQLQEV